MRRLLSILGLTISLFLSPLHAETLPEPSGQAVLTVTGAIDANNRGGAAVFDMEMLSDLPVTEFDTTTLWTEGSKTFTGVALSDLLELLGVSEGTLRASAINDYTVEIPVDSVADGAPIIAYRLDGAEMSRRQKGPLWIVYPYDSDAAFRTEVIYSRSIWQLDRIEVVE
ncbi:molybdopterin-dependent oxidoreductase [Lutimaribacter marinistellae]|uniref:Molybdopterin-dependent oxidoreductase n=1 Tax=Lutimaribacter marinistellae TaxID=1820329 RepID=A0ABV7TE85_9RHOB